MNMATKQIACFADGSIGRGEINRPEKRNALTMPTFTALAEALVFLDAHPEVNAVLVTSAGPSFCAGHDLKAFSEWPQDRQDPVPRFLHAIADLRKPLVLAVHGSAASIGATWMLHADWVICSPTASLRLPFVELAIAPEAASSVLLARAVGLQRARRSLLGGEQFTGQRAYDWGLVSELAPTDDVIKTALSRAQMLADRDTHAMRRIRGWIHPAGAYAKQIDAEVAAINAAVEHQRTFPQGFRFER
jgi:enoyl-CoA hydratase/carnithine racemase